jgi:hypothetical protein
MTEKHEEPNDILRNAPRSLLVGANRLFLDRVRELFIWVRKDCDGAAKALGIVSLEDDGLAAVKFLAEAVLSAARQELAERRPAKEPREKSWQHESVQQFAAAKVNDKREKDITRAGPSGRSPLSERSQWIDELKQMLRAGETKSGMTITSQLAHEIAKQITILNEGLSRPETKASLEEARESIDPFFIKPPGDKKKPANRSVAPAKEKAKPPTKVATKKPARKPANKPASKPVRRAKKTRR